MEMSNNYIPELHVAQQRRREKLRVEQIVALQGHNNNNNNFHHTHLPATGTAGESLMIPPSEMLHFTANIHPTRFVVPSSSDTCESWVPNGYNNSETMDHHVIDHNGRPRTISQQIQPQFLPLQNDEPSELSYQHNGLPLLPNGLSLSLSNQICGDSYQPPLGDGGGGGGGGCCGGGGDPRELKPFESGSISSIVKQSISSSGGASNNNNGNNNQVPDSGGSSIQVHRHVGPLGPFTGYAAILKSSKFLRPAQLLLDEFFGMWRGCEEVEDRASAPTMVSKMHGSDDLSGRSPSCEAYRPDCHERKAKLLHMQEEVCKRHKQYHQQMQMVISAFDSVPGLTNATPYISSSIKTISKHFRCLKNAISDQLKHIKRALGEDFSSPPSFLKGGSSSSLRSDQNFIKVKSSYVGGPGYMGHQNHVWRPQRGLPERAVSILRAWLFDHFLHPYPTDNDKQMLATQTGLTRNQVSNWFINARVRLWKPMVEEIHMLETKTPPHSESDSKNRHAAAVIQTGCKPPMNPGPCEHSGSSTSLNQPRGETNTEQFFQKCSRIETHQVPSNMNSSFIGFLPYQSRGLELGGGLGAVSLTLGLTHGSETSHQQQLQHQYIPQGMPFGGHVIHDFSG